MLCRSNIHNHFRCSVHVYILAFLWILCFTLGLGFSSYCTDTFLLMRVLPSANVSIVGLITASVLPYVLISVSILLQRNETLYLTIGLKAFSSGYAIYALSDSYKSAAWLMSLFLLFSDTISTITCLWLSYRYIDCNRFTFLTDCIAGLLLILFAITTNYFFFAPLLNLFTS